MSPTFYKIFFHVIRFMLHKTFRFLIVKAGNTKGGSITVLLTSCLTGLDKSVLQIKTNIVSSHTADSKPVKQEVNGTVISPFSIPWLRLQMLS